MNRPGVVLAACCLGQFMVILDASVVNVALPVIRSDLGFTLTGLQWVVNAYTVALCGFLLLGGRLADLLGRRRVFLWAIAVFVSASLVGGLAYDATTLVIARGMQGIAAAVMTPATLTILSTVFEQPAARARALSQWGAVAGAGGAVGVLAGGVIVELVSWRWTLLVNLPIGIVLFLLARGVPGDPPRTTGGVPDVVGAVSVTAALSSLVYGLASGEQHGWASLRVLGGLGVGLVLLVVFLVDQAWIAREPLVPLGVFRNRSLSAANVVGLACGAAFFSMFYFLALLLQDVVGYAPMRIGLTFLPLSLGVFAGARLTGRLLTRHSARTMLLAAQVMAVIALLWLARADAGAAFAADLLGPCVLLGLGQGVVITAVTAAGIAGVERSRAGLASGLLNTSRQLGCALGLALLVSVAAARTAAVGGSGSVPALAAGYSLAATTAAGFLLLGLVAACALPGRTTGVPPARAAQFSGARR